MFCNIVNLVTPLLSNLIYSYSLKVLISLKKSSYPKLFTGSVYEYMDEFILYYHCQIITDLHRLSAKSNQ